MDDPEQQSLVRRRDGKVIAGVCQGAGRYFDIDPVVFRVVLGVLALTGGLGLVAYGVVWLLVPMEGVKRGDPEEREESEARRLLSGRVEGGALTAVLVTLVGTGLFLSTLGSPGNQAFSLVLLAAMAGAVYWSQSRRRAAVPAPPAAQPPPTPGAAAWWREPLGKDGTYAWGPEDAPYEEDRRGGKDWREWWEWREQEWRERWERRRDGGPAFGVMLFLNVVVAAAIGIAASWGSQPLGTSLEIGFGSALAVIGLGFVVSAWGGRIGGGTVFMAALVTALLVGSALLPKSIGTQWAHRTWRPATVADVRPLYQLGAGEAALDLSGLKPGGKVVSTRAEIGAGQMKVTVPKDVTVTIRIQVGLGDIQLPGDKAGNDGKDGSGKDLDVQPDLDRKVTLAPAGGVKSAGTLRLDLRVGVGQVTVTR
jgi:phage shock protein PspC (stress-responsive transcriptional regulator)